MKKWEYLSVVFDLENPDEETKELDAWGQSEWELIAIMTDTKYGKRFYLNVQ